MATSVTDIRRPEWRDEHAASRFPFADRASLIANTGEFLPETLFIDASIYIVGAAGRIRLAAITIADGEATLTLGDETNAALANCTFDTLDPPDVLTFYDPYGRAAGMLLSSAELLSFFRVWPNGVRTFTVDAAELCATCCLPIPDVGFRGFVLDDGSLFTGDIFLVGEDGIVLSAAESSQREYTAAGCYQTTTIPTIRVDVIGDPLFRRQACVGPAFHSPRFVRQLLIRHGCREIVAVPDTTGDIKIYGGRRYVKDPAVRVTAADAGLMLEILDETHCQGQTP